MEVYYSIPVEEKKKKMLASALIVLQIVFRQPAFIDISALSNNDFTSVQNTTTTIPSNSSKFQQWHPVLILVHKSLVGAIN